MPYLLSHLVADSARRAPDQVAFVGHREQLTFQQLHVASNQLGRLLVRHGVRPGDRVGIRMPRCVDAAIAVYGVLAAGAVYVPLDPYAPPQSARRVVEESGLRVMLTRGVGGRGLDELHDLLRLVIGATVDSIDSVGWEAWASEPTEPLPETRLGEDLAYILYSSGSTGTPKGIAHTHRSGLAYARLTARTYDLRPTDRIGSHSPLHFDMATLGYLTGPLVGATTVLVADPYTKMPASLSQLIERERITVWYSVPLALVQLLERGALDKRDLTRLRWVLYAGEPIATKHLVSLMDRWPHARFSNVYGPTEVNQCTYFHVDRSTLDPDAPVPIGRTWGDTEGLVVDDAGRQVGAGEVGELLIRSATMMAGYFRRPDLNATAFHDRPDDVGGIHRFYRTGDLVRERPDGELDFLGRKDRQIKIRGYRVEIDAIEHRLHQHPGVGEAAAYKVRSAAGDHVQASVRRTADPLDEAELIDFLRVELPWYAVPQRIRFVDVLPRTSTDKLDRRTLAAAAEAELLTDG